MLKLIALGMSFWVGFLSLSQEILWVRVLGFLTQGAPNILSMVLSCFLLGIAVGALVGKKLCSSPRFSMVWVLYIWLAIVIFDFFIPEVLPRIMALDFSLPVLMVLVILTAAFKATIFPVAHHIFTSVDEQGLGRSLSYVYLCNIMGATLGPLLTGFVFLDLLSLFDVFRVLAWVGLGVSMLLAIFVLQSKNKALSSVICIFFLSAVGSLFVEKPSFYDYLSASNSSSVVFSSENRQGIIHIIKDEAKGDIVYGGNAYDGRVNISLANNSNMIDRVFMLSALHPNAKKILVIGLSGGAWVKVLSGNNHIDKIDVVEINPGYLNYIKKNKIISSVLNDDRVSLYIDDGRKWLRKTEKRNYYDLIIINTTFHWRSHSTNLLSKEMMELVKSSLAQGGIYAFNTTGSKDAHFTAASVFKKSYRWSNFVYSSDSDFIKTPDEIAKTILKQYENWPYDDLSEEMLKGVFSAKNFIPIGDELTNSNRALEIITDDNMIVEYKYGLK